VSRPATRNRRLFAHGHSQQLRNRRPHTDCPFRSPPCTQKCRSGAPGGSHLPTFCARIPCAQVRRRSADMARAQGEPGCQIERGPPVLKQSGCLTEWNVRSCARLAGEVPSGSTVRRDWWGVDVLGPVAELWARRSFRARCDRRPSFSPKYAKPGGLGVSRSDVGASFERCQ
jgi:hypothetical protein